MEYIYNALVLNVVDGDTIDVSIDLGFSVYVHERLRLFGIDTPELTSEDVLLRENAKKAKSRVYELINGRQVKIQTFKTDKYGRYLAKVYLNEICINDLLITENLAKPYYGGAR